MDRQDLLIKKIDKEFRSFVWELTKLSKSEIIGKAYEITMKEDIKGYIESEQLPDYQVERLFNADNTLEALYESWLHLDTSHTEDIRTLLWHLCDYSKELTKESETATTETAHKDNVYRLDFGDKQDESEQSTDKGLNAPENEEDEYEQ